MKALQTPMLSAIVALAVAVGSVGCDDAARAPGDTAAASDSDIVSDTAVTSDTTDTTDMCNPWEPWFEPLGPSDEPCTANAPSHGTCRTPDQVAGYRACLGFEIMEDVTEFSWGPCMPACTEALQDSSRACGPSDTGVQFCDSIYVGGVATWIWAPCARPECLACTVGDTELCGPDTPYPDTLKRCILSQGVPVWFDGNCWT